MADKILSVIIPSYNMEAYLPKCLGSLVIADKDLLQGLDVIVVNDGSKDQTSAIGHEFEVKYPGVFRVIDKANGHYGSCINAALPTVNGEYVKVLDADDSVDTVSFEKLLRGIAEELKKGVSAPDLIVSDYVSVDPDGRIISSSKCDLKEDATTLMDIRSSWFRFTIHTICYRTKNLWKINYRQTEGMPYTDTEWIIDPMITVGKVRYFPFAVTKYLVGRDGQTMDAKVFAKSFHNILRITEGLLSRYTENYRICAESAKPYYRQQILIMLKLIYSWGLMGYDGVRVEGDLVGFDKYLSRYPDFYHESGKFIYGPNHVPFRYVAAWRNYGANGYWKMRISLSKFLLDIAAVVRRKCKTYE